MRIENNTKQADLQYWYPENLKDIKKLVRMAKEVNSYNKVLKQYNFSTDKLKPLFVLTWFSWGLLGSALTK